MSLIRCHFHEFTYDSDVHEICPLCEVRDEIEAFGLRERAVPGPGETSEESGGRDRVGIRGSDRDLQHR
jgi:hypothetical protein